MKEYWFVIITGILSGFIVFGGQIFLNLGLSLFQISFITQLLVVLILLPFIALDKNLRPKNLNWIWILYGFATAIIVFTQYGAVLLGLSVAIVVLLLYTQPLWTIIISRLFFKEKLTKTKIISCVIVLVGMIILVNPFGAEIESSAGVILALVGSIALSLWVIIGSVISKRKVPPVTIKFMNATLTVIFFLIFYPVLLLLTKEPSIIHLSFDLSLTIWIGLIAFSLFAEIINHLFYFKGVRKVPATDAGIILLLEPVTGALLATAFLNQPLTLNIIAGGILILIANYLIIKKSD
jgi:drug/metabolite transporter (DMT)-like permease